MMKFYLSLCLLVFAGSAIAQNMVNRGRFEKVLDGKGQVIGLKLKAFNDNTQLEEAGVQIGDVITEINKIKIKGAEDFSRADAVIQREEKRFDISIVRDGKKVLLHSPSN